MDSKSAPFLFFLPVVWSHALQRNSSVLLLNITSGGLCVLPCPCPLTPERLVLQWARPDLKDGYVWDQKEGDPHSYLHLLYRGRVQSGDGCDVVLTNTSSADSGEYECLVLFNTPGNRTREVFRHVVQLRVQDLPGGDNREQRVEEDLPRQRDGVITSMSLFALILLILLLTTSEEISLILRSFSARLSIKIPRLSNSNLANLPSPETNVLHCPEIV